LLNTCSFLNYLTLEEQSLKLSLGQPWVRSIGDFIFLASACEGRWGLSSPTRLSTDSARSVYSS